MKNFKSPTNRLQRVEDESELEEIKRRLFGDGTTRVESKSKKLQSRCQCAFVDTYPHDHFTISFSEQSLGLKFREGCIVALRKNHDMTINPDPKFVALQTYTVTVTAIDASGNSNTSSIEFTIDEEDAASPLPDTSNPDASGEESGGNEEGISQEMVLIIAFIVALLVLGAIIRTRRSEQDILAETLAVFDDTMDED